MTIVHDPACADYAASGHVERPFRAWATADRLRHRWPDWHFDLPAAAGDADLLRAHSSGHLARVRSSAGDFDPDTPAYADIDAHARRSAGAAIRAMELARQGEKAFSLMRPPGHHATADRAMGFCYFNSVAVAALRARAGGVKSVAVWDFDAHHGNGTEAILRGREGLFFASVHQYPAYPGTGGESSDNIANYPVAPHTPPGEHMQALAASWRAVLDRNPGLILVSAGFDAYSGDPITQMTLRQEDFAKLGRWLHDAPCPAAAALEGGYSEDLPVLVETFLAAWEGV
jgi:acetoin utilization deacetylase AcuC-like enzyme